MTLKVLILTRIHSNLLLSWVVFQGETPFPLLVNGIEETTSAKVIWFTILNERYESTHTVSPARQQSQKTRHWSNSVDVWKVMIHLSWRMTIWRPSRGAHRSLKGLSGPDPGVPELIKLSGDIRDPNSTFLKLDWPGISVIEITKGVSVSCELYRSKPYRYILVILQKRCLDDVDSRHNYGCSLPWRDALVFLGQVVLIHANGSCVNHPWLYKRCPRNEFHKLL